jgi:ribosomal protein L22
MKEHWQDKRNAPIKELKKNLAQQVAKFASRYHATKSNDPHHAMIEQHRWNYEEAKRIRNTLLEKANNGEHIDPTTRIESLIKPKPKGEAQ